MISFMSVEYNKRNKYDVMGIFEKNELVKTHRVNSAKDFLEWVSQKKPRTLSGSIRLIKQFNKI